MVPGRKRFWGNGLGLSARLGRGLLLLSFLPPPGVAGEVQQRFLLICSAHSTLVANAEAAAGVAAAFDRALAAGYEVYAEYRDDQRFPGPDADRAFAEEMRRKYADHDFDAILAFGRTALDYVVAHRGALGMSAPVVFGGVTDGALAGIDLPADVHGVSSRYSVAGTLALARRQPDARRVVVMTGSSPFDRSWAERAAAELSDVRGLAVELVSDLTLEGFRQVAAGLGRDTILILLTVYEDAAGAQFTPLNAAAQIAGASGAPSDQARGGRSAAGRDRCGAGARPRAAQARLTPREREVLDMVVAGRLNKQIAADLGVAEKTVKVHRARVMHKLEARTVADLVRLAVGRGG